MTTYMCDKCQKTTFKFQEIKLFEGKKYCLDCWNIGKPHQMETIEPLKFNRPLTSQIVIDEFSKIIDSQDKKGIEKYGKTIDEAVNYDWELMALEEAADLQKYLVKEIIKLRAELHILKNKSLFKVYQENIELTKEIEKLSKMIF